MYDFIGDIHGHSDELVALLSKLGYQMERVVYTHPNRRVVFLGDYIDRGPKIRQVLKIVRGMTERGIMGNHEFNALCFATPHPIREGEFLRVHDEKNKDQHKATLDQRSAGELTEYMEWFCKLPAWLDLGGARAIHACWDEYAQRVVKDALNREGGMTPAFLAAASDPHS